MKADEIRTVLEEIDAARADSTREALSERYEDFKKNYPVLFEKACDGSLEFEKIDYMLRMLERVQNKSTTQFDASAAVGQKLYDAYVAPRISKS